MRLDDEQASSNIEDRRGYRSTRRGGFGFPRGGRRGKGGMGLGGIIVVALILYALGVDPIKLLDPDGGLTGGPRLPQQESPRQPAPQRQAQTGSGDHMKTFVAKVLGTTERTWGKIFQTSGQNYQQPRLVLFSDYVQSGCGAAQAAMGPFYCPRDQKIYIDLSFYRDMRDKLGAPGDFAQAYVIAHEVGHHVQHLTGIADKVQQARTRLPEAQANALSVRLELQADCLAGIWARDNQHLLEDGDIEEALNAASAIGDDRLQQRSQGYVVPDSFTHGTSAQRVSWFKRGYQSGQVEACDSFKQ